jgi:hypothetical protein
LCRPEAPSIAMTLDRINPKSWVLVGSNINAKLKIDRPNYANSITLKNLRLFLLRRPYRIFYMAFILENFRRCW